MKIEGRHGKAGSFASRNADAAADGEAPPSRSRAQIVQALREGRVHDLAGVPPAEVDAALDAFHGDERTRIERMLSQELPRTIEPPTPGQKAHDVRALKRKPWWSGIATTLPAPLHPEPTRDVEVAGVKLSKDDVASMLRSIGRI